MAKNHFLYSDNTSWMDIQSVLEMINNPKTEKSVIGKDDFVNGKSRTN